MRRSGTATGANADVTEQEALTAFGYPVSDEDLMARCSMGSPLLSEPLVLPQRRQFDRMNVRCRARIRIGTRHYFGYLENISEAGAKIVTLTPIRNLGEVLLRIPDLPLLRGQVRWADVVEAGICFSVVLPQEQLRQWACDRLSVSNVGRTRTVALVRDE